MREIGIDLPAPGRYGAGMVFLPTDERGRQICERAFERVVREEGQTVLGWRTVPIDPSPLGKTARGACRSFDRSSSAATYQPEA